VVLFECSRHVNSLVFTKLSSRRCVNVFLCFIPCIPASKKALASTYVQRYVVAGSLILMVFLAVNWVPACLLFGGILSQLGGHPSPFCVSNRRLVCVPMRLPCFLCVVCYKPISPVLSGVLPCYAIYSAMPDSPCMRVARCQEPKRLRHGAIAQG
jgi:hypothetical protein